MTPPIVVDLRARRKPARRRAAHHLTPGCDKACAAGRERGFSEGKRLLNV
ncbi:MAG: hypothetical protein ACLGIT_05845 [Gammaproteobacteria bacterium]